MIDSKYDKSGKLFLIFTTIMCISIIYLVITLGFPSDNKLYWFINIGLLFSSLANLYISIKEKRICYIMANIMLSITLMILVIGKLIVR